MEGRVVTMAAEELILPNHMLDGRAKKQNMPILLYY
jgi:hypothetical protein